MSHGCLLYVPAPVRRNEDAAMIVRALTVALTVGWVVLSLAAGAGGSDDEAARRRLETAVADSTRAIERSPRDATAYQRRGEDYFRLGKFKESVADFDKVIELQPDREPYHWQRGIALYYAGEFERGAR